MREVLFLEKSTLGDLDALAGTFVINGAERIVVSATQKPPDTATNLKILMSEFGVAIAKPRAALFDNFCLNTNV